MKLIIIFFCCLMPALTNYGQSFIKKYDYLHTPVGMNTLVLTKDSGYISDYETGSDQNNFNRLNIFKIDQTGDTVWTTCLYSSISGNWNSSKIISIDDSTYILIGSRNSAASLIKFDFNGQIIWSKNILDPANSLNSLHGVDIIKTFDNNLAVTVSAQYFPGNILLKIDTSGNILSNSQHPSLITMAQGRMVQTTDSSFVIISYNMNDALVLTSINNSGILKWRKVLPDFFHLASLIASDTGSIIVSSGEGIIKFNSSGDTVWTKTITANMHPSHINKYDNDYVLCGMISCTGDFCMMRIDSAGNILESKKLLNIGNNCPYFILETPDKGFIMTSINWINFEANPLIVKTDSMFNLDCASSVNNNISWTSYTNTILSDTGYYFPHVNFTVVSDSSWTLHHSGGAIDFCNYVGVPETYASKIDIYPNPTTGIAHVSSEITNLTIFNLTGKKVADFTEPSGSIDLSAFQKGIYICRSNLQSGQIYFTKLVLQ